MTVLTSSPSRSIGAGPILAGFAVLVAVLALFVLVPASPARAVEVTIDQCNGIEAGPGGATTVMTCSVVVANTIDGDVRSSTVTVERLCALDPCENGISTTSYPDVVTVVRQCNGSGNDAAHPLTCDVSITNTIRAGAPGADTLGAATVNQCVGSAEGSAVVCDPFPATTTAATVTQCNGSANGGGGLATCSVATGSSVSAALPLTVDQCNGSANSGGSTVTCRTTITTTVLPALMPVPTDTVVPTETTGPTVTAGPTGTTGPTTTTSAPAPTGTSTSTATRTSTPASTKPRISTSTPTGSRSPRMPTGGIDTGGGQAGPDARTGLLVGGGGLLLLGAAGLLLDSRLRRPAGR